MTARNRTAWCGPRVQTLREADCIHILYGVARNTAMDRVSFRQQGILPRDQIVPHLVDKLRAAGKLVTVHHL